MLAKKLIYFGTHGKVVQFDKFGNRLSIKSGSHLSIKVIRVTKIYS